MRKLWRRWRFLQIHWLFPFSQKIREIVLFFCYTHTHTSVYAHELCVIITAFMLAGCHTRQYWVNDKWKQKSTITRASKVNPSKLFWDILSLVDISMLSNSNNNIASGEKETSWCGSVICICLGIRLHMKNTLDPPRVQCQKSTCSSIFQRQMSKARAHHK